MKGLKILTRLDEDDAFLEFVNPRDCNGMSHGRQCETYLTNSALKPEVFLAQTVQLDKRIILILFCIVLSHN